MSTKYRTVGKLDEYAIICLPLVSGATNPKFKISEDGNEAIIRYNWPKPMFNVAMSFKKDNGKEIPKILALEEELQQKRESINDIPEGIIRIKLPFTVQTAMENQIITGFEDKDGCRMFRIELPAIIKRYAQSEVAIKFEK